MRHQKTHDTISCIPSDSEISINSKNLSERNSPEMPDPEDPTQIFRHITDRIGQPRSSHECRCESQPRYSQSILHDKRATCDRAFILPDDTRKSGICHCKAHYADEMNSTQQYKSPTKPYSYTSWMTDQSSAQTTQSRPDRQLRRRKHIK